MYTYVLMAIGPKTPFRIHGAMKRGNSLKNFDVKF